MLFRSYGAGGPGSSRWTGHTSPYSGKYKNSLTIVNSGTMSSANGYGVGGAGAAQNLGSGYYYGTYGSSGAVIFCYKYK